MVKNVALYVNSKQDISFLTFLFAKTAGHSFVCSHEFIDFVCERFPSKSLSRDLYKMKPRQISENYLWESFWSFSVQLICHLQTPCVLLNWISFLRLSDYDMNYTPQFVHHCNEFLVETKV